VYSGFWWEDLRKEKLEKPGRRWEGNIKMDLREVGWDELTGSIWLRIGTRGGLL
jgi:hypothetical protein